MQGENRYVDTREKDGTKGESSTVTYTLTCVNGYQKVPAQHRKLGSAMTRGRGGGRAVYIHRGVTLLDRRANNTVKQLHFK